MANSVRSAQAVHSGAVPFRRTARVGNPSRAHRTGFQPCVRRPLPAPFPRSPGERAAHGRCHSRHAPHSGWRGERPPRWSPDRRQAALPDLADRLSSTFPEHLPPAKSCSQATTVPSLRTTRRDAAGRTAAAGAGPCRPRRRRGSAREVARARDHGDADGAEPLVVPGLHLAEVVAALRERRRQDRHAPPRRARSATNVRTFSSTAA
jgi:hypothetical protein